MGGVVLFWWNRGSGLAGLAGQLTGLTYASVNGDLGSRSHLVGCVVVCG